MNFSFDFTGRNVFVFGGTSGINLGIAEAFVAAGARVGVASRSQAKVDAAVARLSRAGAPAHGFSVDVREPQAVAEALASFVQRLGPVDVLVSGAAGNFPAAAASLSPNGFKSVVDIDLLGTFNVMRAAWPHLAKPGASVISISAPQATVAMAMQVHVCAAKAGVDMITKTLALEWGPEGVRINSVSPGPIDGTEGMARLAPDDAARRGVVESVPLRRMGTPQDIADACLFLASDAARYISGVVLPVDGGWTVAGARMASVAR
ncbi:MAG TPA: SDR family oxidoreductase [Caldimonas sp.]|jgi:NAD(P)-dependent dehydrogenase (short-subunit alcohol dehydrogenase family)|nr:SDR family oxidoreductase [Caldimonas sp.]HEV7577454.1 SDR family oxidoreductase [Caldimonas sp.]